MYCYSLLIDGKVSRLFRIAWLFSPGGTLVIYLCWPIFGHFYFTSSVSFYLNPCISVSEARALGPHYCVFVDNVVQLVIFEVLNVGPCAALNSVSVCVYII